ncbi:MAG: hypothetical protein PVJ41_00245, partial [Desulfobacterales bacterium]
DSDYESVGRRFESCRAHQLKIPSGNFPGGFFAYLKRTFWSLTAIPQSVDIIHPYGGQVYKINSFSVLCA